jgi:hypothetical protein
VRHLALANLISQTTKDAPHRDMFFEGLQGGGMTEPKENDVIKDLKLLCRDKLVARFSFVLGSDSRFSVCRPRRIPGSGQSLRLTPARPDAL